MVFIWEVGNMKRIFENVVRKEVIELSKFIELFNNHKMYLPIFQRNSVWNRTDQINLLNSIINNISISEISFWIPSRDYDIGIPFIEKEVSDNNKKSRMFIIDGQQRSYTLYMFFNNPKSLRIYYHKTKRKFVLRKSDDCIFVDDNFKISFDTSTTYQKISNYQIYCTYYIGYMEEELRKNYNITNTSGRKLTTVHKAIANANTFDFNLLDKLCIIKKALSDLNFGDINDITILQCITVIGKEKITHKAIVDYSMDIINFQASTSNTQNYMIKAINLLKEEFNVISYKVLPYNFFLIALTFYYSKKPHTTMNFNTRKILNRWFWISSFELRYQGASYGIWDKDLYDINQLALGNEDDILDIELTLDVKDLVKSNFSLSSARGRALRLLINKHGAKSFINGRDISSSTTSEKHHIFTKVFMDKYDFSNSDKNSILNLAILSQNDNKSIDTKDVSEYIYKNMKIKFSNKEIMNILESQLMPSDDLTIYDDNDYTSFSIKRADKIISVLKEIKNGIIL